jgi:hypothetical protein
MDRPLPCRHSRQVPNGNHHPEWPLWDPDVHSWNPGPSHKAVAWGAGPGTVRNRFRARARYSGPSQIKYENNMRNTWFWTLTSFHIYLLLFFIFVSHFGVQDPDPDPTNYILFILPFISCLYYSCISLKTSFSSLSIWTIFTTHVFLLAITL